MMNQTPTNSELEILNILWENSPLTVKDVHEILFETRDIGYTTALKLMQLMTEKGFLSREKIGKKHYYYPAIKQENTRKNLLKKFVESTFGGSSKSLVMQLLGNKEASKQELQEIKKIIEDMESKLE